MSSNISSVSSSPPVATTNNDQRKEERSGWKSLLTGALESFSSPKQPSRTPSPKDSPDSASSSKNDRPGLQLQQGSRASVISSATFIENYEPESSSLVIGRDRAGFATLSSVSAVEAGEWSQSIEAELENEDANAFSSTATSNNLSALSTDARGGSSNNNNTSNMNEAERLEAQEAESRTNEALARRMQALTILNACADYEEGRLVPSLAVVTSFNASGNTGSTNTAAAESNLTSPSSKLEEKEDYFIRACSTCEQAGGDAKCIWSDYCTLNGSSVATAWRERCFEGIPTLHRASVWIKATIGSDEKTHAHWAKYYAALLQHASIICKNECTNSGINPSNSPSATNNSSQQQQPSAFSFPSTAAALSAAQQQHQHNLLSFQSTSFRDILKDCERTFPTLRFFSSSANNGSSGAAGGASSSNPANAPGQSALKRILVAFSLHRPIIGYCQSLNFLAALILLVFEGQREELAFALFCHLLESRLAYYTRSMLGCVLDTKVLHECVGFYESEIASTLERANVSIEQFVTSWFLCGFIHAPLALHQAVRIWDIMLVRNSEQQQQQVLTITKSPTHHQQHPEPILHVCSLALVSLYKRDFTESLGARPTTEELMNIFLQKIGLQAPLGPDDTPSSSNSAPFDMEQLISKIKFMIVGDQSESAETEEEEQVEGGRIEEYSNAVATMRLFHRSTLLADQMTLTPSKLRRYERSTGVSSNEIARLWTCFTEGATRDSDRWDNAVSGCINHLLSFRLAFVKAVFPAHRDAAASGGVVVVTPNEIVSSWKGAGVIQSAVTAMRSKKNNGKKQCKLCVPPLPPSPLVDRSSGALVSCPKCTWLKGAELDETESNETTTSPCTCNCSCEQRLVHSSPCVFGRLFRWFDTFTAPTSSASSSSSSPSYASHTDYTRRAGLGLLDFETFVKGCSVFSPTYSNRASRLQAVFKMAGGESVLASSSSGSASPTYSTSPVAPSAAAASSSGLSQTSAQAIKVAKDKDRSGDFAGEWQVLASDDVSSGGGGDNRGSGIEIGRISRSEFEKFVAAFEELYHGRSFIPAPETAHPSSANAPSATVGAGKHKVLSSVASAKMFVSMAFEKERAAERSAAAATAVAASLAPVSSNNNHTATTQPHSITNESLSYESFASFIVLHPLIAGFFKLDAIAE